MATTVAVLIAGCGSGSGGDVELPKPLSQLTSSTPSGLTQPPSRPKARPVALGPPLGTSQKVTTDGSALTVTMTKLYDPLPAGSGASLLPGTRAVGVLVQIDNAGPEIYDSSATGDISLAVSSGAVNPVFASSGVCQTPLQDFDSYISEGVDRSGCVAFSVPAHAKILAIRFSPHAQAAGRLTWRPSP